MPYRGESLLSLLSTENTGPPTRRLLRDVAHDAGAAMTRLTKEHTPKRTGRTAASYEQTPVEKIVGGYQSGTTSSYWKARWVEQGVRPHSVKKRGQPGNGPRHPGHKGAHAIARAAAEVEATLPAIARPALARWASEIERKGG